MKSRHFPKLADVNRQRAAMGAAPVAAVPGVMRPGKTAKKKAKKHLTPAV